MKNFITYIGLLIIFIFINSCDSVNAALSNANINNCLQKSVKQAYYSSSEKKYIDGKYLATTRDGKNIQYKELSWVRQKKRYYLSLYGFNVYYATSPHSNVEYKFSSYCSRLSR